MMNSQYAYATLAVMIAAERLGIPIFVSPVLIAIGGLAGSGRISLPAASIAAFAGCILGDTAWYEFARWRGPTVLAWLCRITLEPERCVRKTQDFFALHNTMPLVFGKIVPGVSHFASPLAGITGISRRRFFVLNSFGAILWVGGCLVVGFFSLQVVSPTKLHSISVAGAVGAVLLGLVAVPLFRYIQWIRFSRAIAVARIPVDELHNRLDAGEQIVVVDLRHPLDVLANPVTIPGALRIRPDELERRVFEIPRDREIVLYCTCPNEATSARLALRLKHLGIENVRPLESGLDAWRGKFPVEPALI